MTAQVCCAIPPWKASASTQATSSDSTRKNALLILILYVVVMTDLAFITPAPAEDITRTPTRKRRLVQLRLPDS
ncbi:hypothetical protein V8E54_009151 [Elaphomyces granulatus]